MNKTEMVFGIVIIMIASSVGYAEKSDSNLKIVETVAETAEAGAGAVVETADITSKIVYNFWEHASPTKGFWGLNDQLGKYGMEFGAALTTVYQTNVKGGTSTHNHRGRHIGRYDMELAADLEKLLGIEGGSFFVHGWGGWPNEEGIDALSVGSAFGTNALAVGNRSLDIVECFYEGPFFGDNVTMAIGKLDFTGIFDASRYADDECCQFLNAALVDDPAIPFPSHGLGIVLNWEITDSWYLMGGACDAQADSRETGFRTAFHKEDYFFYTLETGITSRLDSDNGPMEGTYRAGLWVDGQDKARFSNGKNYRDDTGVYLSCDQMLIKENSDSDDSQGLGGFFRFGYANSDLNEIGNFWSFGFQYQGLIDGRDEDVAGFGFASGIFSDYSGANDGSGYTENAETAIELYYSAAVTPCLTISPSLQYISDPGGTNAARNAVVLGLRAKMTF